MLNTLDKGYSVIITLPNKMSLVCFAIYLACRPSFDNSTCRRKKRLYHVLEIALWEQFAGYRLDILLRRPWVARDPDLCYDTHTMQVSQIAQQSHMKIQTVGDAELAAVVVDRCQVVSP